MVRHSFMDENNTVHDQSPRKNWYKKLIEYWGCNKMDDYFTMCHYKTEEL